MSSSAIIVSQPYIPQQIILYGGATVFFTGILGGILNTIIFLSLHTFRKNSCAFYLTIMSIVNIGQLVTGLLSRITISGFGIDWTEMSLFYCKLRYFLFQFCTLLSLTCISLATIDQYLSTCSRPNWQQWSNIKLSYRLTILFICIWLLHGIPYLIFYDHAHIPNTNIKYCTSINYVFLQYYTYGYLLTLSGILPVSITVLFGLLAYRNVRNIAYRTVPLVRRELDKQLTVMVLVQVVWNFFTILPFVIINALAFNISILNDPVLTIRIQYIGAIIVCLYYSFFASPFYIYMCVSERFRQQFVYVFCRIYMNNWRRHLMMNNQIIPEQNNQS